MSFTPKTRLEKILCGVATTAKTRLEKAVAAAMAGVASALELPPATAADNGSVLGVVNGAWAKDSRVLAVTGVVTENESEKKVMTLDKTAAEMFEAIEAGRLVKFTCELIAGEEPNTMAVTITQILPIVAAKSEVGDTTVYNFVVHPSIDEDDEIFFVENLSGTDTVALTEA